MISGRTFSDSLSIISAYQNNENVWKVNPRDRTDQYKYASGYFKVVISQYATIKIQLTPEESTNCSPSTTKIGTFL